MLRHRFKDVVEYRQAVTDAGGRLCIVCQNAVESARASPDVVLDSMLDLFCRCSSAHVNGLFVHRVTHALLRRT